MAALTRWTYLGLALLVAGLVASGAGAATHLHEQQCRAVQFTSVTPVNATTAGTPTDATVEYDSLDATARQVFREAMAADGQVLTRRNAIDPGVVRYDGDRYRVRTRADRGCAPWHPRRVVTPLGAGGVLVVIGTLLTRGRRSTD